MGEETVEDGAGAAGPAAGGAAVDPDRITGETVAALVAMGLAVFVIANDVTAMSVALPAIEKAFDTDVATVQWVVNAYALVFGVLIVTGGRLADMFGRRRILFIGAAIFAFFSLLGGLAPSPGLLIAARALMGIGGALMWPAILGLVYAILPASKAGLAGGIVIGTAGLGNAAGPVLGGLITQELGWRWILILNVPIAALACLVTWRTVHVASPTERSRIDGVGIATISIGLVALLVALGQAPVQGWTSPVVIGGMVLCAVLLAAFVAQERRAGDWALVPPDIIANRPFVSACVATLLMSATFFAALLYLPQLLQKILGWSALGSGAGLLPLMGTFALVSFAEGPILKRIGMKAVVTTGAALMAIGPVLLVVLLRAEGGYAMLVPGMVVLGVGIGLFYSSVTTAGVTALDASRSSLAGGILYMFQVAGGAVGLGLTTTVFVAGTTRGVADETAALGVSLTADEQHAVQGVLAGTDTAVALLGRFPGEVGAQLVEIVREAFTTGLRWALTLDSALAVCGFLVALLFVAGPPRRFGRDVDDAEAAG